MTPDKTIKLPAIVTIIRVPFFVLIAVLSGLLASGQVKFTTIASSNEVGRSEYLQIEFVIENARQIDQLNPPEFPGFEIVKGPIQSSGMSIINGNTSQYKAVSFVLQPSKTGKFTIQGASAVVDGKKMQSNAIKITVSNTGSPGAANTPSAGNSPFPSSPFSASPFSDPFGDRTTEVQREYVLRPGENIKEKIHRNLFVKVQVDKTNCYVGEPIVATYKLYTRLNSESRVTKRPSLNGFSVYDMVDPSSDQTSVEKISGKPFTVHIIRKTQLIPLQAGSINLDPVEVENLVHFVKTGPRTASSGSGNSLRDLFDQLNDENPMGQEVEESVTLDTKPVTITVKPLPEENKPADFSGAVGSFTLQADLTSRNIAAKEEGSLHVVVKGRGNLPVINAPEIKWPAGIDAFDPTAKEEVDKSVAPMSGSKSFDYVFTASAAGKYTIPAIHFSYFDPASHSYKQAGTTPVDLVVSAAGNGTGKSSYAAVSAAAANSNDGFRSFINRHLEWIFAVLILAGIAFFLGRQNLRLKRSEQESKKKQTAEDKAGDKAAGDIATAGNDGADGKTWLAGNDRLIGKEKAPGKISADGKYDGSGNDNPAGQDLTNGKGKAAWDNKPEPEKPVGHSRPVPPIPAAYPASFGITTDPLQEAKKAFSEGDHKAFYREVNRAVWKAVADKTGLPASELNKQQIARRLESAGWDVTMISSLENIFFECEMNLYTPERDPLNMQQLLRQAESLINRLA